MNLVLAGAASRGVAYLGALERMTKSGIVPEDVGIWGVSIGSLIGACYLAGMGGEEMFDMIVKMDTMSLFDPPGTESLLAGVALRKWVLGILGDLGLADVTLGGWPRRLTIIAVSLEEGLGILSAESEPDMPLLEALLASMAIPMVFPPVRWGGRTWVDGGLLNNFPMNLAPEGSLGMMVSSGVSGGPMGYVGRLLRLIWEELGRLRLCGGRVMRIYGEDFGMVDFRLTLDDKVTLYMRGWNACEEYINEILRREVVDLVEELVGRVCDG